MLEGWRNASQLTCTECNAKNNIFYMHVVRSHSMLRKYSNQITLWWLGWYGIVTHDKISDSSSRCWPRILQTFIACIYFYVNSGLGSCACHLSKWSLEVFHNFIIHALMHHKSVAIYMVSSDSLCVNDRDDAWAVTIVHWGWVSFLGGRGHLWPCHTVNHGLSEHRQTFECTLKKNLTIQYSN